MIPCDAVAQAVKSRQDRKFLRELLRDASTGKDKPEEAARHHQHQHGQKTQGRQSPEGAVSSKSPSGSDGELARPPSARAAIAAPSGMGGNLDAARIPPVDASNPAAVGVVLGRGTETVAEVVCGDFPTAAGMVMGKPADSNATGHVGVERGSGRKPSSIEGLRQELRTAECKDMPYSEGSHGASVRSSIENGFRGREDGDESQ